ncbi:hypothetical protein [Azospirillum argentinense]
MCVHLTLFTRARARGTPGDHARWKAFDENHCDFRISGSVSTIDTRIETLYLPP